MKDVSFIFNRWRLKELTLKLYFTVGYMAWTAGSVWSLHLGFTGVLISP